MPLFFRNPEYDLFALVGGPSSPRPWLWESWKRIATSLDPVVAELPYKAHAKTLQFEKESGILGGKKWSPSKERLRFGRLPWTDAGHSKWTHGSPDTSAKSDSWVFFDYEAWAPSRSRCQKDRLWPDFICLLQNNELYWQKKGLPAPLAYTLIFALRSDLQSAMRDDHRERIVEIARYCKPLVSLFKRRNWGKSSWLGFVLSECIGDLNTIGILKDQAAVGPSPTREELMSLLSEDWEELQWR